MLPWKIKRKTKNKEDQRLQQIQEILFPQYVKEIREHEGKPFTVLIDHAVDTNLDAALIDLQEGNNDEVAQSTINSVINKLAKVRKILNVYNEFAPNAEYLIVDIEKTELVKE